MTNAVEREVVFDQADGAIDVLEKGWPTLSYLPSFRKQVAYLRAVARGEDQYRSRLSEITIGLITAKDIEDRNLSVAETLHELADVARRVAAEQP
jgi:predicted RNA binding protein with dsRBD fold (UPF0201 family)